MRVAADCKDFTSVLNRLLKGFGIKEKCAMLKIVKFKIQLSLKGFQPKLPEWPKGRIFQIGTHHNSLREHPVFSAQVPSFTRREKPEEGKRRPEIRLLFAG